MPIMNIDIIKVTTGGPYSYTIFRNGSGVKTATGFANFNLAWNAVRDDVAAILDQGEVPLRATISFQSLAG